MIAAEHTAEWRSGYVACDLAISRYAQKRVGSINWVSKQFMRVEVGGFFTPFMTAAASAIHIIDDELLAFVLGSVVVVKLHGGGARNCG